MTASNAEFNKIAEQAEQDLNSYHLKEGKARGHGSDDPLAEASRVDPTTEVKTGEELVTNAGYNRRIPPEEGGMLDKDGRMTRGEQFEGEGGPEDKIAKEYQANPGEMSEEVFRDLDSLDVRQVSNPEQELTSQDKVGPRTAGGANPAPEANEALSEGIEATRHNLGGQEDTQNRPREKFKGEDYYVPESVPGSIAAESYEPPESVVEASKETEGYGRQ